jgi:hypothetical protein
MILTVLNVIIALPKILGFAEQAFRAVRAIMRS